MAINCPTTSAAPAVLGHIPGAGGTCPRRWLSMEPTNMLHVVLVATHAERQFASLFGRMLAESRRCKGCFSVHILGWQQPFAGTYVKDDLVLAFAQTLPPSALILHLDAFDTLPVSFSHRDRRALIRGLGDAGLLVSTDLLSRAGAWAWYYSRVFGGDLKVNTGLFIGRAGFIASFLSRPDCLRWRKLSSNQMAWVRCLKQNASGVVLDSEARFFLNLQGDPGSIVYERELDFRGDRAWFRGQRPLFISAPGHKKLHRVQCRLGMLPGGPSAAKARAAHCEARFPLEEMAATASLPSRLSGTHVVLGGSRVVLGSTRMIREYFFGRFFRWYSCRFWPELLSLAALLPAAPLLMVHRADAAQRAAGARAARTLWCCSLCAAIVVLFDFRLVVTATAAPATALLLTRSWRWWRGAGWRTKDCGAVMSAGGAKGVGAGGPSAGLWGERRRDERVHAEGGPSAGRVALWLLGLTALLLSLGASRASQMAVAIAPAAVVAFLVAWASLTALAARRARLCVRVALVVLAALWTAVALVLHWQEAHARWQPHAADAPLRIPRKIHLTLSTTLSLHPTHLTCNETCNSSARPELCPEACLEAWHTSAAMAWRQHHPSWRCKIWSGAEVRDLISRDLMAPLMTPLMTSLIRCEI